jgi:hypothetical protein
VGLPRHEGDLLWAAPIRAAPVPHQKIVELSPVEGGSHAANESLSFLLPTEQKNGIAIVSLALGLQVMPAAPSDITDTSRKPESVQA